MFRDELDALNAIYEEQKKTNELLTNLLKQSETQGKEGAVDAAKGRGRGNPRKGAELPVAAVDSKKGDAGKGQAT